MWLPADRLHRRRTAGGGASASVSSAPSSRLKPPLAGSPVRTCRRARSPVTPVSRSQRSITPACCFFFLNLSYWRYFSIGLDVRYAGGVWLVRPDISSPASSSSQSVSPAAASTSAGSNSQQASRNNESSARSATRRQHDPHRRHIPPALYVIPATWSPVWEEVFSWSLREDHQGAPSAGWGDWRGWRASSGKCHLEMWRGAGSTNHAAMALGDRAPDEHKRLTQEPVLCNKEIKCNL